MPNPCCTIVALSGVQRASIGTARLTPHRGYCCCKAAGECCACPALFPNHKHSKRDATRTSNGRVKLVLVGGASPRHPA